MKTINDKNFSFYKTVAYENYKQDKINKLFRTISQSMILIRKHKVVFQIFTSKNSTDKSLSVSNEKRGNKPIILILFLSLSLFIFLFFKTHSNRRRPAIHFRKRTPEERYIGRERPEKTPSNLHTFRTPKFLLGPY